MKEIKFIAFILLLIGNICSTAHSATINFEYKKAFNDWCKTFPNDRNDVDRLGHLILSINNSLGKEGINKIETQCELISKGDVFKDAIYKITIKFLDADSSCDDSLWRTVDVKTEEAYSVTNLNKEWQHLERLCTLGLCTFNYHPVKFSKAGFKLFIKNCMLTSDNTKQLSKSSNKASDASTPITPKAQITNGAK